MEFKGKCFSCDSIFWTEHENLVHFTKARKYDWPDHKCAICGFVNKYARFSYDSNLLTIVPP